MRLSFRVRLGQSRWRNSLPRRALVFRAVAWATLGGRCSGVCSSTGIVEIPSRQAKRAIVSVPLVWVSQSVDGLLQGGDLLTQHPLGMLELPADLRVQAQGRMWPIACRGAASLPGIARFRGNLKNLHLGCGAALVAAGTLPSQNRHLPACRPIPRTGRLICIGQSLMRRERIVYPGSASRSDWL